jgi:tRNA-modifying protein YgfZ
MGPGYQALREHAAFLDLSARGRIYAFGEDRARLLHAMSTNQVRELKPGEGVYAFFLNAQGHILADANLFVLEDRILMDVEAEQRHAIFQHLDKFIIADDVTLEDVSDSFTAVGVEGPEAEEKLLCAMGAPIPEKPFAHLPWKDGFVARVSVTGLPGFRIFVPKGTLDSLEFADAESIRVVRIEQAKPRYGDDIFETTLPHETRQMHALSFNKGCYLGQEIVERIRSRGHVNRILAGLEIESTEAPASGARLQADAADVGEITSVAFSPALGRVAALGYIRAKNQTGLTCNGLPVTVKPIAGAPEAAPAPKVGC